MGKLPPPKSVRNLSGNTIELRVWPHKSINMGTLELRVGSHKSAQCNHISKTIILELRVGLKGLKVCVMEFSIRGLGSTPKVADQTPVWCDMYIGFLCVAA